MDELKKGEGTTDIEAIRLWNSYPGGKSYVAE